MAQNENRDTNINTNTDTDTNADTNTDKSKKEVLVKADHVKVYFKARIRSPGQ